MTREKTVFVEKGSLQKGHSISYGPIKVSSFFVCKTMGWGNNATFYGYGESYAPSSVRRRLSLLLKLG